MSMYLCIKMASCFISSLQSQFRVLGPAIFGLLKNVFPTSTFPESNSSHLKIGLPKRKLVFQSSIFRCYARFREGKPKMSFYSENHKVHHSVRSFESPPRIRKVRSFVSFLLPKGWNRMLGGSSHDGHKW